MAKGTLARNEVRLGSASHVGEFEFISAGNGEPWKGFTAREKYNPVSILKGHSGSWGGRSPDPSEDKIR